MSSSDAIRFATATARNLGKFTATVGMESGNLAGADTEGRTRRIAIQKAGDKGTGEIEISIRPTRDEQLDKIIVTGVQMPMGREQTLLKGAQDLQTVLGENIRRQGSAATLNQTDESITNSTGLGTRLASFFASAMSLSNNTGEMHERSHFLNEAQTLVNRFHLFAENYQRFEASLHDRIQVDVEKVNIALEKIAEANREIKRAEAGTQNIAAQPRDRREEGLRELGELISFRMETGHEGHHHLILKLKDTTGADITLLERSQIFAQVEYDSATQTYKTTGAANPLALTGGSLRGHQKAVTELFPELKGRMDALANQVFTSVNSIYGDVAGSGTSFFTAAGTAADIEVNPLLNPINLKATETGHEGENEVIKAIGDLATASFSTANGDAIDGTFKSYVSGLVSHVGNEIVSARNKLNAIKDTEKMLLEQDFAKRGVSLPESIANIQKAVQAFEYTKYVLHTLYKMDITDSFKR